jgi:hypothetical protein
MAAIRRQHEQAEWIDLGDVPTYISGTSFSVPNNRTAVYQVGRRIRIVDGVPATFYGTITASVFGSVTTVTVALDSGAIAASVAAVAVGLVSVTSSSVSSSNISGTIPTAKIADGGITPAKLASAGNEFGVRNYLVNGAMGIDQRNVGAVVSLATGSKWVVDQWAARQATGTPNTTVQQVASGLDDTPFCLQVSRASGADTTAVRMFQVLDNIDTVGLAGKTITVSFQLLKGSSCSNTTLSFFVYTGTGTNQTITQLEAGSWTGGVSNNALNLAFSSVGTSFAQYSFTTTVPAGVKQLCLYTTNNGYTGSGSANDFYRITDICLTTTSTVVPVPRRDPRDEAIKCMDFYEKSYDLATAPGAVSSLGVHDSVASTAFILANGTVYFKRRKRATPTITLYSPNSGTSGVAAEHNTGGTFVADRTSNAAFIGQNSMMVQVSGTATVANDIRFQWAAEAGLL